MEKKDENGKTYYYLDFVSNEAQNEYVKCIVQDKYLESLFNSKDTSYENDDIIERMQLNPQLRWVLQDSLTRILK